VPRSIMRLMLWSACLVSAAACGGGSSSPVGPSPRPVAPISLTVTSATTERRDDGNLSYAIAFQIRGTSAGVTATVSTLTVLLSAANNLIATATVPAAEVLPSTRIAGATSAQSIVAISTRTLASPGFPRWPMGGIGNACVSGRSTEPQWRRDGRERAITIVLNWQSSIER
jgi:hypothetical protein